MLDGIRWGLDDAIQVSVTTIGGLVFARVDEALKVGCVGEVSEKLSLTLKFREKPPEMRLPPISCPSSPFV